MSMENGSVGISDTVISVPSSTLESDVGLALKLQSTESSPFHHQGNQHRPLSSSETVDGVCGAGPTSISGANEVVGDRSINDISHDDVAAACSGGAVLRTLQPFDISTTTHTAFKSPGPGGMAATLGFPFTSAQWKELERQAMIYKYMMASVPVPPDLLLPITRNLSPESYSPCNHSSFFLNSCHLFMNFFLGGDLFVYMRFDAAVFSLFFPLPYAVGNGSIFNLRFSGSKETEPGRCKRTDGKKWRCSRDVAPHQKYCERHMHKGRPRSRKPVEVNSPISNTPTTTAAAATRKKTRLHHNSLPTIPTDLNNSAVHTNNSSPQILGSNIQPNQTTLSLDKSRDENISSSSYQEPNRSFDWLMEGEVVTSEQQWKQLMRTNIELTTEGSIYNTGTHFFPQDCREDPLNLISYADFSAPDSDQQNSDCTVFLNPDLMSLEKEPQEAPRGFIDAWSKDNANAARNRNESSVFSPRNISPSSLNLSMAMAVGNSLDEEMGQSQMRLGVTDSNQSYGIECSEKLPFSSWLGPVSWVSSTPGGPLAEVLQTSTVPASPYASNGGTVSSPSGVLHRKMFSLSDSSGCNSPALAASTTATPEITSFKWPT